MDGFLNYKTLDCYNLDLSNRYNVHLSYYGFLQFWVFIKLAIVGILRSVSSIKGCNCARREQISIRETVVSFSA